MFHAETDENICDIQLFQKKLNTIIQLIFLLMKFFNWFLILKCISKVLILFKKTLFLIIFEMVKGVFEIF